jgi:hypothetical protein
MSGLPCSRTITLSRFRFFLCKNRKSAIIEYWAVLINFYERHLYALMHVRSSLVNVLDLYPVNVLANVAPDPVASLIALNGKSTVPW